MDTLTVDKRIAKYLSPREGGNTWACDPEFIAAARSGDLMRLRTLLRAALWRKLDVAALLDFCGTALGNSRYLARPEQAYSANS